MKIKTIIASVSAVLLVTAMSVAALWASHVSSDTVCQKVEIVLRDSAAHQFVTTAELLRTLQQAGLSPLGTKMDQISCQAIEDRMLQHDMVRTAQCYKSPAGTVFVEITQRVPMLYVQTADGNYYVDTDRRVMPVRSTIHVQVPVLKGAVSQRAATEEYYDFVQWLNSDRYWQERITQIHVRNPKHIVLTQREVAGTIVLGELKDYQEKMARLRKLYVKGFDEIGYTSYKEYDLRFAGQVVGRK